MSEETNKGEIETINQPTNNEERREYLSNDDLDDSEDEDIFQQNTHVVEDEFEEILDSFYGDKQKFELCNIPFYLWDGKPLLLGTENIISLNCQFEYIDNEKWSEKTPNLLLIGASTGSIHCIVSRDDFPQFLRIHSSCLFVFHCCFKQFFVISSFLEDIDEELSNLWLELPNRSQIRDTQILDSLLRLALIDSEPGQGQDLYTLCSRYLSLDEQTIDELSNQNQNILDYMKFLKLKLTEEVCIENTSLLASVVRPAIAVALLYQRMIILAYHKMRKHRKIIDEDAAEKFGPLTETIQVRSSIALWKMKHNGISVDLDRVNYLRTRLTNEIRKCADKICEMETYSELFQLQNGQRPQMKRKTLENLLLNVRSEIMKKKNLNNKSFPIPLNPRGEVSLSTKKWKIYMKDHPFLEYWISMEKANKYLSFIRNIYTPIVHPTYTVLVRNGRTSASSPNIQQMPRDGGYREVFKAREGNVFIICDYNFIELCTLAIVCERKFGFSMLAKVIRKGVDPHCFTAAMFENISLEEFMAWKNSNDENEREKFKSLRQRAKAINFGIPGGEGALALQEYALSAYGVTLTIEESSKFREELIRKVYPELSLYLFEDCMDLLAHRLGCNVNQCWSRFGRGKKKSPSVSLAIRNIIEGKMNRTDGKPYQKHWVEMIWRGIKDLNRNEHLKPLIESNFGVGSEELAKKLFGNEVATTTGRIRGGVTFTQGCNTPFSGLAADGAKLALYNLLLVGFKLIAFIHDEIVVEVPISDHLHEDAQLVNEIMCESMQEVTRNIPIKCEVIISRRWSKAAQPTYENGRLTIWEPSDNYILPPL